MEQNEKNCEDKMVFINRGDVVDHVECPRCEADAKSTVFYSHVEIPLNYISVNRYWDAESHLHSHDINPTITEYYCSKGHIFHKYSWLNCWCGWDAEKEALLSERFVDFVEESSERK